MIKRIFDFIMEAPSFFMQSIVHAFLGLICLGITSILFCRVADLIINDLERPV